MKISYNWLSDYIDLTGLSSEEVGSMLTSVGLEVEEITPYSTFPAGVENLIVGKVIDVAQHPNADRLRLTKVDVGNDEILSIVCGAPNVEVGQKVIVAKEGVTLHTYKGEQVSIKKSKIRGEVSEGMICAEDEIGIGESHEGIMVLPDRALTGDSADNYLNGYRDWTIDISLTPNRVDAASHIGVARDLSAISGRKLKIPYSEFPLGITPKEDFGIQILDPGNCPRYSGIIIRGIQVKESPEWLRNKMRAAGLNPINNIVDATNFVMYEMGQPLHAFDLSQIKGGKIIVRQSIKGTKFTTLDKSERELSGTELMICNADEPMALAGVFGGLKSGITNQTTDIFIESAYFNPTSIRKTSRLHQLFTDASFRYERGADPNITVKALQRVAEIILQNAGGYLEDRIYDEYPMEVKPARIVLKYSYVDSVAGTTIPVNKIVDILNSLDFTILETNPDDIVLEVPTYRVDVKRPIDVVEEVLRIYSFDKIPFLQSVKSAIQPPENSSLGLRKKISSFLTSNGFFEARTLSFLREEDNLDFHAPYVSVINPISVEMGSLRNNLLVPLLKVVQHNINRQRLDNKFFEWGNVHLIKANKYIQESRLCLIITGNDHEQSWSFPSRKLSFFTMKGWVESILDLSRIENYTEENNTSSDIAYGLVYKANKNTIASFGAVSDTLLKRFGIETEVFFADFDAETLQNPFERQIKYKPISKFPRVERDLALEVPEKIDYSEIKRVIESHETTYLKSIRLFDVYHGQQVAKGKKSYAINLTFEDSAKTLDDKTIERIITRITGQLSNELGISIRR